MSGPSASTVAGTTAQNSDCLRSVGKSKYWPVWSWCGPRTLLDRRGNNEANGYPPRLNPRAGYGSCGCLVYKRPWAEGSQATLELRHPVRWFELGHEQIHLIPSDEPDTISPRHSAIHVEDVQVARDQLPQRGVEVRETVPIAGADRSFISDPAGNNLEFIQWFRRWDDWSEDELGVPDNAGRRMLTETAKSSQAHNELPTASEQPYHLRPALPQ